MNKVKRIEQIEQLLDDPNLSHEAYNQLNNKANTLQAEINQDRYKAKLDQEVRFKEQEIEAQLQALNMSKEQYLATVTRLVQLKKDGKMAQAVEEFGGQFVGDYHVDHNFTVRSACKNDQNPNLTNVWHHNDLESANLKVFQLVYWRVYNHYFRGDRLALTEKLLGLSWVN